MESIRRLTFFVDILQRFSLSLYCLYTFLVRSFLAFLKIIFRQKFSTKVLLEPERVEPNRSRSKTWIGFDFEFIIHVIIHNIT